MNLLMRVLLFATLILAFFVPVYSAQDSHDHHGGMPMDMGAIEEATQWQTDEPLREGMTGIRNAVASVLPDFHAGNLGSDDAGLLVKAIDDNVNYMLANCELEPEADATLHVLLSEILAGKSQVEKDPRSKEGIPGIVKALRRYPHHFHHEGWRPIDDADS